MVFKQSICPALQKFEAFMSQVSPLDTTQTRQICTSFTLHLHQVLGLSKTTLASNVLFKVKVRPLDLCPSRVVAARWTLVPVPCSLQVYIPSARRELSICVLPDGNERYASMLRFQCDVPLSPAEIHQIGRDQVAQLKDRMSQVCSWVAGTVGKAEPLVPVVEKVCGRGGGSKAQPLVPVVEKEGCMLSPDPGQASPMTW